MYLVAETRCVLFQAAQGHYDWPWGNFLFLSMSLVFMDYHSDIWYGAKLTSLTSVSPFYSFRVYTN